MRLCRTVILLALVFFLFFSKQSIRSFNDERTNERHLYSYRDFYSIHPSHLPYSGRFFFSLFCLFFPFIGLTSFTHPGRLKLFMYRLPFRLPCRFLYPPTDVLAITYEILAINRLCYAIYILSFYSFSFEPRLLVYIPPHFSFLPPRPFGHDP